MKKDIDIYLNQAKTIKDIVNIRNKKYLFELEQKKESEEIKRDYENFIGENESNLNLLKEIVKGKNQKILLQAPCSAGKTYTMDLLFKHIEKSFNEDSKYLNRFMNIILCPTRVLNIQNSKQYGFSHLIKETSSKIIEWNKNYSCVYEMFPKLYSFIVKEYAAGKKGKVNIIIDESQQLLNDRHYRDGVKIITNLVDELQTLGIEFNIIYMTGTPEGIKPLFEYDKIISFNSTKKHIHAKNLNIYECSDENDLMDLVVSVLDTQDNCLTQIQSKNGIERIKKTFENKKEVNSLTSDDKKYTYMTNEDNTELLVVYDNKLLQQITESEKILPGVNLSTTCLNAGTNNKYCPEGFSENYVVSKVSDMHIEVMVQFFNRTRSTCENYNIFINKTAGKKKIVSRESIRKEEIAKLERFECIVRDSIDILKNYGVSREDIFNDTINYLKTMKIDGEIINFSNVISVDENLNVNIDMLTFENRVYQKYNEQFYYNKEALVSELKKYLNVENVNFYDDRECTMKCAAIEDKQKEIKEKAIQALENIKDEDICKIKAVLEKKSNINLLNETDREKIKDFLAYRPYRKILNEFSFFEIPIEEIIAQIKKSKDKNNLKEVYAKYRKIQHKYLGSKFIKFGRVEIPESNIILSKFYKLNENGNIIQQKVNAEIVHELAAEINCSTNKYFNDKDVLNLIKNHFVLKKKVNQKYDYEYTIKYLKTLR